VIGLPPAGGAWSKWYLTLGAVQADQLVFVAVLLVSSLLNIAYLIPIPIRGFFSPAPAGPVGNPGHENQGHAANPVAGSAPGSGIREAPLLVVVPLCVTAAGCIVLFFLAGDVYRLLAPIAGP
jgi:multicomponent Na+:H+ antiporter subunit D